MKPKSVSKKRKRNENETDHKMRKAKRRKIFYEEWDQCKKTVTNLFEQNPEFAQELMEEKEPDFLKQTQNVLRVEMESHNYKLGLLNEEDR